MSTIFDKFSLSGKTVVVTGGAGLWVGSLA